MRKINKKIDIAFYDVPLFEEYLSKMAESGLYIHDISSDASKAKFVIGTPAKVEYFVSYNDVDSQTKEEYLMSCVHKGLELVVYSEKLHLFIFTCDTNNEVVRDNDDKPTLKRLWEKCCIRFCVSELLLLTILFSNFFIYIRYTYEFYTIKPTFVLFITVISFLIIYIIIYSLLYLGKLKHFKRYIEGHSRLKYNGGSMLAILKKVSLYFTLIILLASAYLMYYTVKTSYYSSGKYKPVKYVSVTEIPTYAKILTLDEIKLQSAETSIIEYPTSEYIITNYRLTQKSDRSNKENDFELRYSVSENEFVASEIYKNIKHIKDDRFAIDPEANWVELDKYDCERLSIQQGRYFIGKKYIILVARGKRDNFMLYLKGIDTITEDVAEAIAHRFDKKEN